MPSTPRSGRPVTWTLAAIALLLPLGIGAIWSYLPARGGPPELLRSPVSHFPPSPLSLTPRTLGPEPGHKPRITNVRIVDLDRDGRPDVLVCDGQRNRVFWYRQLPGLQWEEVPLGDELACPAGATPADLDGDGDLDIAVAVLGSIWPTDDRVGQVVWLENRGGSFQTHRLLDDVRRVSDVQAADFDRDGDLDLAVAVFGYQRGEVLWLENRQGKFRDHLLLTTSGPSHVPVGDFDGDGDPDITVLVSQEHEEIWAFENRGEGQFAPQVLHRFTNFDLGGAGLIPADLDRDGDLDLVLSAGDNLEIQHHYPQPWHGCLWLENQGSWRFHPRRAAHVGGVYAASVADFDQDGDQDIVLACMFNDWRTPGSASLVLLENDGRQEFTPRQLAERPTHLATVAAGDLDGDQRPDIVAGSLHLLEPFDRLGRVTLWLSQGGSTR